jgi:hypothetical protein
MLVRRACAARLFGPRFKSAEVAMKIDHLFVCVVAASMSLIGCGKRESSEPPLTPASAETESAPETPASVEDASESEGVDARQCVSTDDCGPGYVCGFDPELSRVVRHCMPE